MAPANYLLASEWSDACRASLGREGALECKVETRVFGTHSAALAVLHPGVTVALQHD